ncbi:hypothetical protein N9H93_01080 [Rhizobiaceae bacterium]|nr:hypothetical protein [Rhizobiaceae bacterium]
MKTRFRHSARSFRETVISAAGLTVIVTLLAWLMLRISGAAHVWLWTGAVALIFFAFCSAAMIWRYLRDKVVLAVRPDGLFDARAGADALAWDDIRTIALTWREDEFHLSVNPWPTSQRTPFDIDVSALDGSVGEIVEAITVHHPVLTSSAEPLPGSASSGPGRVASGGASG